MGADSAVEAHKNDCFINAFTRQGGIIDGPPGAAYIPNIFLLAFYQFGQT